jgi:PadR family transcriptional regulator PadR
MVRTKTDNLQGTLALLVLKSLEQGPMHGWGITLHIQRISNDVLRVEEGSLYPALYRLEQRGLVKSEWKTTVNKKEAKFYSLTKKGVREMDAEAESWTRLSSAIGRVLAAIERGA